MYTIKVGLIEDQNLFREGIKVLLNADEQLSVVFESPDGFSVSDRLKNAETTPDVMLIDLSLPANGAEEFSGWRVLSELNQTHPEMKKLILSVNNDPFVIAKTIEEGANGYLAKDVDPDEVKDGIKIVYEKGSYINSMALNALLQRSTSKPKSLDSIPPGNANHLISERELEILEHLCQGKTTAEIAQDLYISEKTVNGHRYNLLQKTGAKNAAGLVMYAVKHGLVEIK